MRGLFIWSIAIVSWCASSCVEVGSNTLCFAGDVMLARDVKLTIKRKGMHSLFANIAAVFQSSDISLVNLECPLTETHSPVKKQFVFAAPCSLALALRYAGLTHVNLTNNHALDHNYQGLASTLSALQKEKIIPVGLSAEPCMMRSNGTAIAIFGANLVTAENSAMDSKHIYEPTGAELVERMRTYRNENPRTLIVLNVHWGFEYREFPTSSQRTLAHRLIDSGVTVVAGHHPHVVQPIEFYSTGVILYSLGNLVFDQAPPGTRKSMVVKVDIIEKNISKVRIYPLLIESCIPSPCSHSQWGDLQIIGDYENVEWIFMEQL